MYSDSITYTLTNLGARDKTVRLMIERDELLYDIGNMAFVEGDIMQTEDAHERHQVIDAVQDGNRDRVDRMLNKAFAEVVEATYPLSKREVQDHSTQTDHHEEHRRYVLNLTVPNDFSESTVTYLVEQIHEYMVCAALSDWMSITNPSAAEKWAQKQQEAMEQMRIAINRRVRRVRRTMSPF